MKNALRRNGLPLRTENAFTLSSRVEVLSTLTRGTVQLLAARTCLMTSGYVITVILARGLGPIEYGVYGVILSALLWVELVGSAGIPGATASLIPRHENEASAIEQTATAVLLIVSVLLFSLCWSLAPAFSRLFNISGGTTLFRLAILDIPFNAMYLAYQGLLHGHRRFGVLSIGIATYGLTKLFGILTLLYVGLSVPTALLVNVAATVGVLVYLLLKSPPKGLRPSYTLTHSMLRVALPMGLYLVILQVLLSLDLWSLKSIWAGPGEVIGIYVAALNISKVLIVIPAALSGVLFASLSWALARDDEAEAQRCIVAAARFTCITLFPLCTLLALHAESVMVLFFSGAYATGGAYLAIQLVAFGLLAFFDLCYHALMAAGKHQLSAGILLALIPVALLFNLGFIPALGPIGAAVSLALTIGIGTTIGAVLVYRNWGCLIQLSTVIRVVAATLLMALVSTQVTTTGPWLILKFVLLLALYGFFLGILKEITWGELKALALRQKER